MLVPPSVSGLVAATVPPSVKPADGMLVGAVRFNPPVGADVAGVEVWPVVTEYPAGALLPIAEM